MRAMVVLAPDTKPLPPVEQLRPGLWTVPVPLPIPLRYVFVYVFETDRGPFLVDAGWNTDEAYDALCAGLGVVGTSIADVQGVMVTHIHPDHYGLAGRVRDVSGAWIALHPNDASLIHDRYFEPGRLLARMGTVLHMFGAPPEELDDLRTASMPVLQYVEPAEPDVLMEDGDRPEIPGWDLTAIWTPGHSPGHLCFWEPANSVLLTGDCVLPRITPNIAYHAQSDDDPLGDYLRSLEKLATYDAVEALPAHELRFTNHQERLREIRDHHEQRFAEVIGAVRGGRRTVWEIAPCMDWSRPWDEMSSFIRRQALGEAAAHVRALEVRGRLRRIPGDVARWEPTA
jgi:glyoxylase-like metal-dependent hydrolase (beta-lactamase superfamily II)